MSVNVNPETGIRYGVISGNSLDSEVLDDLFYVCGTNLTYEEAVLELRQELECEADAVEEEAQIALHERGGFTDKEFEALLDREVEAAWLAEGYDDREDYIETLLERRSEDLMIEEPVIEGECDGVKYRIDWLGGAPLVWVMEGPVGRANRLCSPCVPNAADLDGGYFLPGEGGDPSACIECYCVPRGWLRKED